jgi:hypothetical protein
MAEGGFLRGARTRRKMRVLVRVNAFCAMMTLVFHHAGVTVTMAQKGHYTLFVKSLPFFVKNCALCMNTVV